MGFRFWRRIRLMPGVTLNLSKSNASLSFGPRGAKYTVSPKGNRVTAGIPGTGLFYTMREGSGRSRSRGRAAQEPEAPKVSRGGQLSMGFFQRLFAPEGEKAFVDGLRALHEGRESEALTTLESADGQPDARWMAGVLRLKQGDAEGAIGHFKALLQARRLGTLYEKYGVAAVVSIAISDEVTAHLQPRLRGVRLALAEAYQESGDNAAARRQLERLREQDPEDVVVRASLAEILLDVDPVPQKNAQAVVEMTGDLENASAVHAALLLYKGRALRALGLDDAAYRTLTKAYRRRKDRPESLRRQIRYERALAYEGAGKKSRARKELEGIYAEDPDFEDVAERLGL